MEATEHGLVTDAFARGEGNLLAGLFLSTFTITLLYKRPKLERYPSLRIWYQKRDNSSQCL